MSKIIDITELLRKRDNQKLDSLKKDLDKAIDESGLTYQDIFNNFVNFNGDMYDINNRLKHTQLEEVLLNLLYSVTILANLGFDEESHELNLLINKILNISKGDTNGY